MTRPRSTLISLESTPYYHCISRCVRRAFLFGKDSKGRSFDHRKQWLVERIKQLGDVFAINIAAYAVMSNHYHLVLHIDQQRSADWLDEDVIRRWTRLFRGPELVQRYLQGEPLTKVEMTEVVRLAQIWRDRLTSISWFMSCLNYVIALKANREDGCTGRFWEGRYKSQALKDETALLACMAYVDLNPVRARVAVDLTGSDFSSIQDRLQQLSATATTRDQQEKARPALMPFTESGSSKGSNVELPFMLQDYLALVDWHGHIQHPGKKGFISASSPDVLRKIGLSEKQWRLLSDEISKESITMLHGLEKLAIIERRTNRQKAA